MENEARRPLARTVSIAALAVLVALVAAVSAFAFGGSGSTAGDSAPTQGQYLPVQEYERSGPGGRHDCPERDRQGGGSQPQDDPATPDPSQEL